jgi:hypothetical protein
MRRSRDSVLSSTGSRLHALAIMGSALSCNSAFHATVSSGLPAAFTLTPLCLMHVANLSPILLGRGGLLRARNGHVLTAIMCPAGTISRDTASDPSAWNSPAHPGT